MKELYFDVFPKIVPADEMSEITIKPGFEHLAFEPENIEVYYVRDDGKLLDSGIAGWNEYSKIDADLENGVLRIRLFFAGEFEHTLKVVRRGENNEERELGVFNVYSLSPDLFGLRPYKGDFHMHSNRSDGIESPAYVAASARRIGLDFMALTDHRLYEPSLEAIDAMAEFETDLKCFPGEEVHPPDNPVHIVNFGGRYSVNDLLGSEKYRGEVAERESKLSDISTDSRYQVASSEWVFDKIREAGGLAMYCHPYWKPYNRFSASTEVNERILKRRKFDILEVIGGFYRNQMESNALAVARYHELRAEGAAVPVAGVSDAHGCDRDLFGWYYTIVLAESNRFEDLSKAIKSLKSVAVEAVPGEFPRVVGPFRLVKFVYFLLREFYPLHDRLCEREGKLMLEHLSGDELATSRLAELKGLVPRLLDKYWATLSN